MWTKKVITLSLSTLVVSLTIVSCTTPKQSAEGPTTIPSVGGSAGQTLTSIKVGHLVALDMAPLFVGVESGCFKQNGLAVETVVFTNPGDNNAALAGSAIDFNINPFTLPFFAASSGVPIKTIAAAGG